MVREMEGVDSLKSGIVTFEGERLAAGGDRGNMDEKLDLSCICFREGHRSARVVC